MLPEIILPTTPARAIRTGVDTGTVFPTAAFTLVLGDDSDDGAVGVGLGVVVSLELVLEVETTSALGVELGLCVGVTTEEVAEEAGTGTLLGEGATGGWKGYPCCVVVAMVDPEGVADAGTPRVVVTVT